VKKILPRPVLFFAISAAILAGSLTAPSAHAESGTAIDCVVTDSLQQEPIRLRIFHGAHSATGQFMPSFVRGAFKMRVRAKTSRHRPNTMLYPFGFRVQRAAEGNYGGSFHPTERIQYTGVILLNLRDPSRSSYILNSNGTFGKHSAIGVKGSELATSCTLRPYR
jgi:hypothetical protein